MALPMLAALDLAPPATPPSLSVSAGAGAAAAPPLAEAALALELAVCPVSSNAARSLREPLACPLHSPLSSPQLLAQCFLAPN